MSEWALIRAGFFFGIGFMGLWLIVGSVFAVLFGDKDSEPVDNYTYWKNWKPRK